MLSAAVTPLVPTTAIPTGLATLDDIGVGGVPSGRLTVLAGERSAGTSALLFTMATHNALQDRPTVFLSGQDSAASVQDKFLAAVAGVNIDRPATLGPGRILRIGAAADALRDRPLWLASGLWEARCPAIRKILACPADQVRRGLLLVDGVRLLGSGPEADLLHDLEGFARELDIAVVASVHLKSRFRAGDTSAALRELRGMLASTDAAAVVLVHRPDRDGDVLGRRDEVDLIPAAGWPGTATATVRFEPHYHRLVDLPNT